MATRFYFPLDTAAPVTVSFASAWAYISEALTRKLENTKGSSTITAGAQVGPWTASQLALDRQYISAPMAAGVVFTAGNGGTSGQMQLMTREYNNGDNTSRAILGVRVVSEDGQTVRATLYPVGNYFTNVEFVNNVTHRNCRFLNGDPVSGSYTTLKGDRLVVEIGYSDIGGSTPEGSAKWGENATDLPQNETQTTDGAGWIEFSNTIAFDITGSDSGRGNDSGTTTASVSANDTGRGTEAGYIGIAGADSGSSTETVTSTNTPSTSDSGVGEDTASLVANILVSDAGYGEESITVSEGLILVLAQDSGVGEDSVTTTAQILVEDSGQGSENVIIGVVASDGGAGAESGITTSTLSVEDSGYGDDSFCLPGIHGVDEGSSNDACSLSAQIVAEDIGSGVEASTPGIVGGDIGFGSEISTIEAQTTASDSGIGVELVEIAAQIPVSDSGNGSENHQHTAEIPCSDSNTGTEDVIVGLIVSDSSIVGDSGETTAQIASVDFGFSEDSAGLTLALFILQDFGVGADVVSTEASIFAVDTGIGQELAVIDLSTGDSGSGEDSGDTSATIVATDVGIGTDFSALSFAQFVITDFGLGVEEGSTSCLISGTDEGRGEELCIIQGQISSVDSGVGNEEGSVVSFISVIDTGLGIETLQILLSELSLQGEDSGLGFDQGSISTQILVEDFGFSTDVNNTSADVFVEDQGRYLYGEYEGLLVLAEDQAFTSDLGILHVETYVLDFSSGEDYGEVPEAIFSVVATDFGSGIEGISPIHVILLPSITMPNKLVVFSPSTKSQSMFGTRRNRTFRG